MTALTCPLCGNRPRRDDRGDDGDLPNISIGYRAALQCECGLRLERYCAGTESASELTQLWRSLTVRELSIATGQEIADDLQRYDVLRWAGCVDLAWVLM